MGGPMWEGADGKMRPYPGQPFRTPRGPHAFIQWKGTEVCMDVYCACGEQFHIDADFAYFVRCPACGAVYQSDWYVRMKKVDPAEAYIEPKTEEGWQPDDDDQEILTVSP